MAKREKIPGGDPELDQTEMMVPLEEVLMGVRSDALVLEHHGYSSHAEDLRLLCEDVAGATRDYSTWLSEDEAARLSHRDRRWLLERYRAWAITGHARCHRSEGLREYRRLVVLATVAEELLAGA